MKLVGANPDPQIESLDPLPGQSHYFSGNDPKKWKRNIPLYGKVRYRGVYPGVDLVYHGRGGRLEYDFVVAAGADVDVIALEFEGVRNVRSSKRGDLVLSTAAGTIRYRRPKIYQEVDGKRKRVAGGYVVQDGRRVRFHLGAYDRSRTLVIDPVLVFATYLGGRESERGTAIAVDRLGCVYLVGRTTSTDFPSAAPFQATINSGMAAFVTKLDPSRSALVYTTYLGGTARLGLGFQAALGMAIDGEGAVYVSGFTDAVDFPVTSGAVQPAFGGITDAFVSKLDPTGSTLLYSTYVGGSGEDAAGSIAADDEGSAHVMGSTNSIDFPMVGAFQGAFAGGERDVFVAGLSREGSRLLYASYLGGAGEDIPFDMALDRQGATYVTGWTGSRDFPTADALQPAYGGGERDGFLAKVSHDGSALIYSTYLGGSANDGGTGVAVDTLGNVYVAGVSKSGDFLPASNRFSPPCPSNPVVQLGITCSGSFSGFVIKLDETGSSLAYSARMDWLIVAALAVDTSGNAYLAGSVGGTGRRPLFGPPGGLYTGQSNLVVGKLNATGTDLKHLAFFVGAEDEQPSGIAIDPARQVYVLSTTNSDLRTIDALQVSRRGDYDVYIARISESPQTGTFYLPQAGGGGALSTEIVLTNLSATTPANAVISFFGPDGKPLQNSLDEPVRRVAVPPASTVRIATSPEGPLHSAYARLSLTDPLVIYATYSLAGFLPPEVSLSLPDVLSYSAPVSRRGRQTGIAVVNVSEQAVRVVFSLQDAQGRTLRFSRGSAILGPGEQLSRNLTELIPNIPPDFQGTLKIVGLDPLPSASLVVTVLEYGPDLFHEVPLTLSH